MTDNHLAIAEYQACPTKDQAGTSTVPSLEPYSSPNRQSQLSSQAHRTLRKSQPVVQRKEDTENSTGLAAN